MQGEAQKAEVYGLCTHRHYSQMTSALSLTWKGITPPEGH